ncbi:hypothetical protein BLJAPNOD_04703 [Ensifer sp. M14]|uniref:ferritin-like domain-containing protein n=1 Tax=Ensifer sp. M14 TaxID=2203782 RepID=UPI000E1C9E7C|nr:ferritin family protein [Ensifer sp. M14]RDL48427.1 hypothetical protein BLJAPNOD_04703 [Ensifer sp. M14]
MNQQNEEAWDLETLDDLLAVARAMEQDAIDGYIALAARMRSENQPELALVFDRLVAEEESHLSKVNQWIGDRPVVQAHPAEDLFDDEGAGVVSPELLNSYRAFSMAVRNEERAFVFWTYVAAHTRSAEIQSAAERMAREELGHVSTLRRERRKAFHEMRREENYGVRNTLDALENRLAGFLEKTALDSDDTGIPQLVAQSRARAQELSTDRPLSTPLLSSLSQAALDSPLPLCELLLDCYLDLAERSTEDDVRKRMQIFASELVHLLHSLRGRGAS